MSLQFVETKGAAHSLTDDSISPRSNMFLISCLTIAYKACATLYGGSLMGFESPVWI